MVELAHEIDGDRIIITLDPGQPVELHALSSSFAALARIYERHYRTKGEESPKLYVTRLSTGSVILEITPFIAIMGAITVMDGAVVMADFADRLRRGIKAFALGGEPLSGTPLPPPDDAADLKEFTRPLLGKNGASLNIRHARFHKRTGRSEIVAEYEFNEAELNRAAINIDNQLALPPPEAIVEDTGGFRSEVMLFLEQANRGPGKEAGRTGDRGVIPDISPKVLPVYFRRSIQGLKERMLHGEANPFGRVFVVTVHVTAINGEVQAYTVTDIHDSFPRESV